MPPDVLATGATDKRSPRSLSVVPSARAHPTPTNPKPSGSSDLRRHAKLCALRRGVDWNHVNVETPQETERRRRSFDRYATARRSTIARIEGGRVVA